MARNIQVEPLTGDLPREQRVEIVERKGAGHPDTLCDLLAEEVSRALCKFYIDECGYILHHNVDKALLVGGEASPSFEGGRVIKPIELIVAGRAVKRLDGKEFPVENIAEEAIRKCLNGKMRHLDFDRHMKVNVKIRPGSRELVDLFCRFGKGEVPLSNDTSCGAGFYPLDSLETAVLNTEKYLNSTSAKDAFPFVGEDIKVMGVRIRKKTNLTIAIAIIDKYVSSVDDYRNKIKLLSEALSSSEAGEGIDLRINTADDYEKGSIYLTVTGTSAEQGDDGQVGRGNRVNGLITPYRPMTLEAPAGKNPVSHVGKIYNIFALDLCRRIVEQGYADDASAFIVSQIGSPVNEPQVLDIKVRGDYPDSDSIKRLALEMLEEMPSMWMKIVRGEYEIA